MKTYPAAYFEWREPHDLLALTKEHKIALGEEWKSRRGREFREAYIAARFAVERAADAVRLLAPEQGCSTPDFAIKTGSRELLYESTEIDRPGRRRGDEQPITTVTRVSEGDYVTAELYAAILRDRSGKKAAKDYDRCDGLIIYDNAFPVEDRELLTLHWWADNTQAARARFAEVWCFHSDVFRQIK